MSEYEEGLERARERARVVDKYEGALRRVKIARDVVFIALIIALILLITGCADENTVVDHCEQERLLYSCLAESETSDSPVAQYITSDQTLDACARYAYANSLRLRGTVPKDC